MVKECNVAFAARGSGRFERPKAEDGLTVFRRSLYVVEDIASGEAFTARNIRSIRPGHGLPPKHLNEIYGKSAARDLKRGTPLSWDLIAK